MKQYPVHLKRVQRLEREWERVVSHFLPVSFPDSTWRYSRSAERDDPDQGWKLHLTATVLTATEVLTKVGPCLQRRGVMFKAPTSLQELDRINSGLDYG
ncbi:MAG TPA: hypothetical protein VKB46_27165, partial [Pyrinomonadaceae bacterium]|nr:hypothetical protein [Pyrinomonadaceae bacterium]